MSLYTSICKKALDRQFRESDRIAFERALHVTPTLISRIGLEGELQGHSGCVNCLEWNESGTYVASGSDDVQVILWDPFSQKAVHTIHTGHTGNIFSVKFLPNSNDSIVVSGAADCKIHVHDVQAGETTHIFSSHAARVKRITTAPNVPFMFWSAAEDGTVMQFDLRDPELSTGSHPKNVLINLNAHMGPHAEAKCLAINPRCPDQLAVGANDPYVRLYDRRMLSCKSIQFPTQSGTRSSWERQNILRTLTSEEEFGLPEKSTQYYVAGHLPQKQRDYKKKYRTLASTYLTFSPDGQQLLVNLGGEQIYLFDVNHGRQAEKFEVPNILGHANGIVKEATCAGLGQDSNLNGHSNGCVVHRNGTTANGVLKHLSSSSGGAATSESCREHLMRKCRPVHRPLPPNVEAIKHRANSVFEKHKYTQAILLYNQALAMAPDSAILYGNRAAAFMKRNWDGDLYAALRDCRSAIRIDANHLKAHFRLAKCLFGLSWSKEALECLQIFKIKFPDYSKSHTCEALDRDIRAAIFFANWRR